MYDRYVCVGVLHLGAVTMLFCNLKSVSHKKWMLSVANIVTSVTCNLECSHCVQKPCVTCRIQLLTCLQFLTLLNFILYVLYLSCLCKAPRYSTLMHGSF